MDTDLNESYIDTDSNLNDGDSVSNDENVECTHQ